MKKIPSTATLKSTIKKESIWALLILKPGKSSRNRSEAVQSKCAVMTLIDLIRVGLIRTDTVAETFAASVIDAWHEGTLAGNLRGLLGLSPREYQAWTTGHVSLLTIANWRKTGYPPLEVSKPWFKIGGRPGREKVGYLEDAALCKPEKKTGRTKEGVSQPHAKRVSRRGGRKPVSKALEN